MSSFLVCRLVATTFHPCGAASHGLHIDQKRSLEMPREGTPGEGGRDFEQSGYGTSNPLQTPPLQPPNLPNHLHGVRS